MTERSQGRILFLTFPKCGSQWVRDVLMAGPVLSASPGVEPGLKSHSRPGVRGLPDVAPGTISGPIYAATPEVWESWARPADRAVAVLRDPRDMVVSWLYSAAYSHKEAGAVAIYREPLRALSPRGQLILSINVFARGFGTHMKSWIGAKSSESLHLTSYERLVENQVAGFREILDFLEWPVPQAHLERVVAQHSFEQRSGRLRGENDQMSHYRRGVSGDWRNHFDRLAGRFFERLCPGLLTGLGYETEADWFEGLSAEELAPTGD